MQVPAAPFLNSRHQIALSVVEYSEVCASLLLVFCDLARAPNLLAAADRYTPVCHASRQVGSSLISSSPIPLCQLQSDLLLSSTYTLLLLYLHSFIEEHSPVLLISLFGLYPLFHITSTTRHNALYPCPVGRSSGQRNRSLLDLRQLGKWRQAAAYQQWWRLLTGHERWLQLAIRIWLDR